jgi:hypothetical protein
VKDRLTDALRASHADYTEIRLERTWTSHVAFRGRRLETATASEDQGGFVRALHHGCGWGIAAFTSLDQLTAMVARAGDLSRAVRLERPIRLGGAAAGRCGLTWMAKWAVSGRKKALISGLSQCSRWMAVSWTPSRAITTR